MDFKSPLILFLILISGLFFNACQKQNEIIYDVPDVFSKYIKLFEQEAKARGHQLDLAKTGLIVEFQNTGNLVPNAVGLCYFGHDGSTPKIGLDENYWNSVNEETKELTIFHELGHCVLNRNHKNDTLANGHWASILRGSPETPDSRPLHYTVYRDYYIDELFDPQTAPPTRTSKIELTYPKNSPLIKYDILSIGQTQSQDIIVSNSGDGILNMTSLDLCSDFTANISSAVLLPNSQKTLSITFSPTTLGIYNCNVYLNSNDPDNPQIGFNLKGIAVENNQHWTQVANFKGYPYSNEFAIGNKGYVVDLNNEVWEYIPNSNQWVQKNNFPGNSKIGGTTFVINGKAYLALGSNNNDVWEYTPQTDSWIKKTDFPSTGRSNAVGFTINNKGYIAGGNNSTSGNVFTDFWEYNPSNDTWTQKQHLIHPIDQGVGFAIGNKGYVGLGKQGSTIYEYSPILDQWFLKMQYPSAATINTIAFVINGVAYIGSGTDAANSNTSKFWKYTNNTWQMVTHCPIKRAAASTFVINNKAYFGGGYINSYGYVLDFWEFTP